MKQWLLANCNQIIKKKPPCQAVAKDDQIPDTFSIVSFQTFVGFILLLRVLFYQKWYCKLCSQPPLNIYEDTACESESPQLNNDVHIGLNTLGAYSQELQRNAPYKYIQTTISQVVPFSRLTQAGIYKTIAVKRNKSVTNLQIMFYIVNWIIEQNMEYQNSALNVC